MSRKITLTHGSGGRQMHELIQNKLLPRLRNKSLEKMDDSAVLPMGNGKQIAMTTDSYVVNPLFFPGGDIGRLCICGTVNDLATSGAEAAYLSLAFILEEGFSYDDLERIIDSIAKTAEEAGVIIVTGDTKVVEKGKGDGIYINTCGVGFIRDGITLSSHNARKGDSVIVTGPIGNHETALLLARKILIFETAIESDAAPLNRKVSQLLEKCDGIHCIKDPTRGGLSSALSEICSNSGVEIYLKEEEIPVDKEVQAVCDLAGLNPMFLANEGKYVIICDQESTADVLELFPQGKEIGKVSDDCPGGRLLIETSSGGIRKASMLETAQLPRIC